MSDVICTSCRGETAHGCWLCNPAMHPGANAFPLMSPTVLCDCAAKDQRIRELEAEVARLKAQSRALTTVLEGEREKLRAVGELPGKWRDKTNLTGDTLGCKYGITAEECADELEALLKSTDEPRTRPIQGGYLEKDTLTGEVHEPITERDWTSDAWTK